MLILAESDSDSAKVPVQLGASPDAPNNRMANTMRWMAWCSFCRASRFERLVPSERSAASVLL
jgi:hypothetical protein